MEKLEFKGTKEEWRDTFNNRNERGVRSDGGYIAIMPKPNRYSGQDERYERELIEYKANAKLIASSPNLLEALQNIVNLFEVRNDLTFEQRMSIDISKAAIQKAIG